MHTSTYFIPQDSQTSRAVYMTQFSSLAHGALLWLFAKNMSSFISAEGGLTSRDFRWKHTFS